MIRRVVTKILISALALWAADYLLSGFSVSGGLSGYLVASVVLGLLNMLVRPILKLLTFPLILLTFGLFTLVINAVMLLLTAHVTGLISIIGTGALVLATLILSGVHLLFDSSTDE